MRPVSSLWCSERAGRVRTLAAWCGIRGKCPSSVGAAVSDPLPVWPASVGNEAGWGRCPTGLRHPGHSMLGAELLRCEVNRIRVSIRGFGEWCRAGNAARLPRQIAGLTGCRANAQRSYGGHVASACIPQTYRVSRRCTGTARCRALRLLHGDLRNFLGTAFG